MCVGDLSEVIGQSRRVPWTSPVMIRLPIFIFTGGTLHAFVCKANLHKQIFSTLISSFSFFLFLWVNISYAL